MQAPEFTGDRAAYAGALLEWIRSAGATRYDASVTQYEHALQSAALAQDQGEAPELIVASLLHDVGHLIADEHAARDGFLDRDLHHEAIGANYLSRAFGPAVTQPIRLHVDAKRYLCAVDHAYHDRLSDASKRSLEVQGGPMEQAEAERFIAQPFAQEAVRVRRIDDEAKRGGAATPEGAEFRPLILLALASER